MTVLVVVAAERSTAYQASTTGTATPLLSWKVPASPGGDYVLALAVDKDGLIYAGSWIGTAVDVFGPDGARRRRLDVGRGAKALAVAPDGAIYVGTSDCRIVVFENDGTRTSELAVTPCRGASVEALAVGDDGVVYATAGNSVYAMDRQRTVRWHATSPRSADSLTLSPGGTVYVGAGDTVLAFGSDGKLRAKLAANGGLAASDGIDVVALAVGRSEMVFAGTRQRTVHAIDGNDGSLKWTFKPKGTPFALAVGPDDVVYVGSFDGNIHALDASRGTVRWRLSTGSGRWGEQPVHALALGGTGVMYAGVGSSVQAISVPTAR